MPARPWTPALAFPHSPRRRLTAALGASAIAHALFLALAPGPAGRSEFVSAHAPVSLAARLVVEEPRSPVATYEVGPTAVSAPKPAPVRERRRIAPLPAQPTTPAGQGTGLDVPDATYYGVRQLDVFPALAATLELRYPARAATDAVKGRVTLLVLIDAHGGVNDVSVVDAAPPGYFEEDALRALRGTRFRPAQKDGRPVKSRLVIELNYGDS